MQVLRTPNSTGINLGACGPHLLVRPFAVCRLRAPPKVEAWKRSSKSSSRCLVTQAAADSAPVVEQEQQKEGVAHLKHIRGSASKFRRVLDQVRGRSYEEALMILEYLPYRACEDIMATLISAASNAKNNAGASKVKLYVTECFADQAGLMKRFQPHAKGRPFPIHVQRSHITIRVAEREGKPGKKTRSQ